MIYWAILFTVILGVCLNSLADDKKTDLSKDIYIETSTTNIVLAIKSTLDKNKIKTFQLSASSSGDFTLLCFIDGALWTRTAVKLPGFYQINTGGLAPGNHSITLQAVDAVGRIGSAKRTIRIAQ